MASTGDVLMLAVVVLILTLYTSYLHSLVIKIQRAISALDARLRAMESRELSDAPQSSATSKDRSAIGALDARLRAMESQELSGAHRSPATSGFRPLPSIPDLPHSPKRSENGEARRVSDERRNKFLWLVEDYKRTLPDRDLRVDRFFETVLTFDTRYSPRPVDPYTAPPALDAHTDRLIDVAIDALDRQAAGKANPASVLPLVDMALEALYREIASVPAPPQDK